MEALIKLMNQRILITGATDGIGLETAKLLCREGHEVVVHGRNESKVENTVQLLAAINSSCEVGAVVADLSELKQVQGMAQSITERFKKIDVLINNAGVFGVPSATTALGIDVRFVVNTLAPVLLTRDLLPLLGETGRILNLSSAAQATVDVAAMLAGRIHSDREAYAQSKLAITMWTSAFANSHPQGPAAVAVNPGSLLATNMVKEAFGVPGKDIGIGAGILSRLALQPDLAKHTGEYFDNDAGRFNSPHPDALDKRKVAEVMAAIESLLPNTNAA